MAGVEYCCAFEAVSIEDRGRPFWCASPFATGRGGCGLCEIGLTWPGAPFGRECAEEGAEGCGRRGAPWEESGGKGGGDWTERSRFIGARIPRKKKRRELPFRQARGGSLLVKDAQAWRGRTAGRRRRRSKDQFVRTISILDSNFRARSR